MPDYRGCMVDTMQIMKAMLHEQGQGGDATRMLQAVVTAVTASVQALGGMSEVVTERAGHFRLHHQSISASRVAERDLKADTCEFWLRNRAYERYAWIN